MKLLLVSEHRIRLTERGEVFTIETTGDAGLSPFHLLAGALASCTYAVLHGWAHQAGVGLDDLAIDVEWKFGGDPVHVAEMRMELHWPGLPASRREAARRVAAHCTIHHTLQHGTRVITDVAVSSGSE